MHAADLQAAAKAFHRAIIFRLGQLIAGEVGLGDLGERSRGRGPVRCFGVLVFRFHHHSIGLEYIP